MRFIKSEKGASLVEFVLVLPLLLLFIAAIIEFSVVMFDRAVVHLASREGARAAVVWRPENLSSHLDTTAISDEINKFLGVVGTDPARLITFGDKSTALQPYMIEWSAVKDGSWDATGYDPDSHNYMRVIVRFRYDFMVLGALDFMGLPSSINVRGETIMRMESPG